MIFYLYKHFSMYISQTYSIYTYTCIYRNTGLIFFYFFNASIASIIGITQNYDRTTNSIYNDNNDGNTTNDKFVYNKHIIIYGKIVYILYEVTISTAFLITVLDYTLLHGSFSFSNMSEHFLTTIGTLQVPILIPVLYVYTLYTMLLYCV